jgi:hypothetical protein
VAFAGLLMAYFRQSKRRTALFLETLLNRKRPVLGRLASSGTMAVFSATRATRKPQPCFAALAATSSQSRSGVT